MLRSLMFNRTQNLINPIVAEKPDPSSANAMAEDFEDESNRSYKKNK